MIQSVSKGFTLLEVLVALMIISLFAVSIAGMTATAVKYQRQAKQMDKFICWLDQAIYFEINDQDNPEYSQLLKTIENHHMHLNIQRLPSEYSESLQKIIITLNGKNLSEPLQIERLVNHK